MPPWLQWFLQTLFGSLIGELLAALGVGTLIAVLKAKKEQWANPLLYGLIAFVLVFVLGFTLTGRTPLSKQRPDITPDNVEDYVKKWADDFQMSIERQSTPDQLYFVYVLRLHNGDPVQVLRAKQDVPTYLQFAVNIDLAPEHLAIARKMNKDEDDRLMNGLIFDLAKSNLPPLTVASHLEHIGNQDVLTGIAMTRGVPISELTEGSFGYDFDEMVRSVGFMRGDIPERLQQFHKQ